MATRRRLRKEDQEEIQHRKKELRKSYEKSNSGKKKGSAKRLSDTQKYLIVGSVAVIIIIIVAVQFLTPPTPTCYYTEGDFVYASLDQDSQTISFNHIVAFYLVRPAYTTINCDITDFFNSTYQLTKPAQPTSDSDAGSITYHLTEVKLPLIWSSAMKNGVPLQMSSWINEVHMTLTPSSIPKTGETKNVNFLLAITTQVPVDRYNLTLKFNKNIPSTTLKFINIKNGISFFPINGTIFTQGLNLTAKSTILLNFNLSVSTTQSLSELNLLETGVLNLFKQDQLLQSYAGASAFKESEINFKGFGLGQEPNLQKSKFTNIVVNIPYYNITLT